MKAQIRGLFLKKGWYYYRGPQVDGVRPRAQALRTKDFSRAVELVTELRQRQHQEATREPMKDLVEAFLAAKLRGGEHRSATTTDTARPGLRRFLATFKGAPSAIDAAAIERWKESMLAEGLSTATVSGYLRYTQSFFSWLKKRGQILANPFDRVTFPKGLPTRRDLVCTKAQRDHLIRHCPDADLQAVLFLGFHAGLRRQEILNLRREWLVCDDRGVPTHIRVQNERAESHRAAFSVKDAEAKIIPLSTPLATFLVLEYGTYRRPYLVAPQYRPGRNKYRWDWKHAWRTYMRSQGMEWVTPHVMRHTFVSLLLSGDPAKRPSLLHLSRWTGTGIDVLQRTYAHLLDDPELINAAN